MKKRLLCLLLLFGLAVSLTGCLITDASNQLESCLWEAIGGSKSPSSDDFIPEEGYLPRVYTQCSDEAAPDESACPFQLPAIDMPGPAVQAINQEIQDTFLPLTHPMDADPETPHPYRSVDYKWAVKGDVLSLVVMARSSNPPAGAGHSGYAHCAVYNVSVKRCCRLENAEVYAAANINGIENLVSRAIAAQSGEWYLKNGNTQQLFSEENQAATLSAFSDSLSEERCTAAMPYYNVHNQLCVIAEIIDPLSQQRYWADICLNDFRSSGFHTAQEYYDHYAELAG